MAAGMAVMTVATVTGILGLLPLMGDSALADWTFPIMALAYAVMMFASSFVEEEQHFWYWVASGWFMALFLKEWVVNQIFKREPAALISM
jgi:ethanolaminephosphotransferase